MARGGKRREGEPTALGGLIRGVYPGASAEVEQTIAAFAWWERAVSGRIAENARPVSLKDGVLTVHVRSASWSNDLHFAREDLLASVRRTAPKANVRDLRIRVGPLPDRSLPRREPTSESAPAQLSALPDDIARELASVRDDALRQTIAKAASLSIHKDESPTPSKAPKRR